jgi:hypothetical protein
MVEPKTFDEWWEKHKVVFPEILHIEDLIKGTARMAWNAGIREYKKIGKGDN